MSWVMSTIVRPRACRSLKSESTSAPGVGVEIAGRLVGEDQRGLCHEGPCDPDPLLLAARELGGLMAQSIAQAQALEGLLGLLEALAAADALVHQRRGHVLQGARARQQVVALEHEADGAAPHEGQAVVG